MIAELLIQFVIILGGLLFFAVVLGLPGADEGADL